MSKHQSGDLSFDKSASKSIISSFLPSWLTNQKGLTTVLMLLAALTWVPRLRGPIDLRWDGGVYYTLGTSIAEGKGYKLLNEPGEIAAVQYPPLLPLIIAAYQIVLRTNDPTTIGQWLRFSAFILFLIYIYAVFRLGKRYLPLPYAFCAAILCLFSLHVYFLSDLCFPEILFSLTAVGFVLCNSKNTSLRYSTGAYVLAVASYALRTIGIALLMAWVIESVLKRNFKQALLRLVMVLIPVVCWQLYISSVEKSHEYQHPSYSYQRAPYMFYNVTYSRNISLEDPFAPEKGPARVFDRFTGNLVKLPAKLEEAIVTPYASVWLEKALNMFGRLIPTPTIMIWFTRVLVYAILLAIISGLLLLFLKKEFIIPLFASASLSAICMTPFLEQYHRYLMPLAPFLFLSITLALLSIQKVVAGKVPRKWVPLSNLIVIGPVLFVLTLETLTLRHIYRQELREVTYFDNNAQLRKQRLFFRTEGFNNYNLCIDYIKNHARATDVVASEMPHWLYLRTGLKSVMPPFEFDASTAQKQMESVPVTYLIIGNDVIGSNKYTLPVIEKFANNWKKVFIAPDKSWIIYQTINK